MITVLNAGATLEQLEATEIPTPENAGSRWHPIRHDDLVYDIKADILHRGWTIQDEKYTLTPSGATMAGALLVDGIPNVTPMPGLTFAIGFLNDNTRRKALQLTVGGEVACCTNGMCTGNILLSRVHDRTVNLSGEVHSAINKYTESINGLVNSVTALRETEISPEQASDVLMRAGRGKLVGWAAIGRVDAEYQNPTFAEHGAGTAWALLNAFTYAARKNIHPTKQMETFNKFRQLLPGSADLN